MIWGIQSGMVMQRGKDERCHVWFGCDREDVTARCLNDDQTLTVEKDGDRYLLKGLFVGGPYTIEVGGEVLTDIYVGDLWLLAGQSNMQGIGRIDHGVSFNTDPYIRAYYMDSHWGMARHPLHEVGKTAYGVHKKISPERELLRTRLVGPGLSFAKRMYEITGVPQGVISCAHGGTKMTQWDPERASLGTEESLYAAMMDRFHSNGSHVKGMFWFQGCSDTPENDRPLFKSRMVDFIAALRRDVGDIPVVQTQIGRFAWPCNPLEDKNWESWNDIRQQQNELPSLIARMDTVHTIALELADDIHLEGASHEVLGRSAAESMFYLLHGRLYGCMPGIRLEKVECFEDEAVTNGMITIALAYDNVHGQLDGGVRPQGFALSNREDGDFYRPLKTWVDGRYVYLKVCRTMETIMNSYLWYGIGHDPACNIVDGKGRSLPGFGPLKMSDLVKA